MAADLGLLLCRLLLVAARVPRAVPELGALAHLGLRGTVQLGDGIVQDVLLALGLHRFLRRARLALVGAAEVPMRHARLLHHLQLATSLLVANALHERLRAAKWSSLFSLVG